MTGPGCRCSVAGAFFVISGSHPKSSDVREAAPPVWSSEFRISHRLNLHFQVGKVYFADDAALIHSPIVAPLLLANRSVNMPANRSVSCQEMLS
jgi:hypothetical protein